MQWLDVEEGARGLRPQSEFGRPRAWRAGDVGARDWTVAVPDAAVAEMEAVVELHRRQRLPTCMLAPEMFTLDACARMMAEARSRLDHGVGVALLDRLPVERWTAEEANAVYWLLGRLLSQPVAQEWNGLMFRDILDAGGDQEYGNERAVTSRVLTFHTDNSGNRARPDYVGLMCLGRAAEGGESQFCSLYAVHDALAADAPDLLARLFEPYLHDRQGIQAPGEIEVLRAPVLTFDGERLRGRYSLNKISQGYRKAGVPIDAPGQRALDAVVEVIDRHHLACAFTIERGQVQFFNNLEGLHHRADYKDAPEQRRHMVRTWYRNRGRPFFDG
ncbi:MAG: TauD/TfdA family dioxygenase [Ectothiorhodospiraceae bacterium]|nr:TauD/TfdA family dioxygenase [Ectothiorhodospiraceae bacterium]